jgi:Flp pilus assembly protein TadD
MAAAYLVLAATACGGAPSRAAAAPSTIATLERAEQREQARRYDEARALYIQAGREAPDERSRAHAARRFAAALMFWGEYADAETELELVVKLQPDDPAAWHDLGLLRHRRGDAAGAETALRRSIESAPNDARPRIALAAVFVNQRRFRAALAQYERILELDIPERTRAAVHEGMKLLRGELRGSRPNP